MSAVLKHLARIEESVVKSPIPGDIEMADVCAYARFVAKLCDLLGFEFRGARHMIAMLEGADVAEVPLDVLIEDPDLRPYIWDLED